MLSLFATGVSPSFPTTSEARSNAHAQAIEPHPSRSVTLAHRSARRKLLGAVKRTDVVKTEESSLEDVVAALVLAVDPPVAANEHGFDGKTMRRGAHQVKLIRSFWKTRSRKWRSARPCILRSILKTRNVALRAHVSSGLTSSRRELTRREQAD